MYTIAQFWCEEAGEFLKCFVPVKFNKLLCNVVVAIFMPVRSINNGLLAGKINPQGISTEENQLPCVLFNRIALRQSILKC